MALAGVDAGLGDRLQDKLFKLGVSGALVDAWTGQEQRRGARQDWDNLSAAQVPESIGIAASQCFTAMCVINNRLNLRGWFACAGLFDAYHAAVPAAPPYANMPAICAAIANLIMKMNDSNRCFPGLTRVFCDLTATFFDVGDATELIMPKLKDVHACEIKILRAVGGQLVEPSVYSWASLLYSRLCVLAGDTFEQRAAQLWTTTLEGCRRVITQCRVGAGRFTMPRRLANGLVGVGLLSTGLMPWEMLAFDEDRGSLLSPDLIQLATACESHQLRADIAAIVIEFQRPVRMQLRLQDDTDPDDGQE